MRVFRLLALSSFVVSGLCQAQDEKSDKMKKPMKPKRMLVITQSKGFVHGSVRRKKDGKLSACEIALKQLGEKTKLFTATCSQDCARDFTKENLQNYDIVTFYTTGKLPIAEEDMKYFMDVWLKQKGHGFMGFHSATDTYKNFKPYWDMVGGVFNGHPWNSRNKVTISVHEPNHPTMKPFGKEFQIMDEIYQYKKWQPKKVRVLMSLNMAKCKPKQPYMVPVAWVKPWGKGGRIYVNNLGHNEKTWTDKRFLKSIEHGVKWVTGEIKGKAKPNPELSAQLEAKAKKDTMMGDVEEKVKTAQKKAEEAAKEAAKAVKEKAGAGK